jgi:hypothetical protein
VPSIDEALREYLYGPVLAPFRMLVSAPAFRWLVDNSAPAPDAVDTKMLGEVAEKMQHLLAGVREVVPSEAEVTADKDGEVAEDVARHLRYLLALPGTLQSLVGHAEQDATDDVLSEVVAYLLAGWDGEDYAVWGSLLGWLFTQKLGSVVDPTREDELGREWFDAWLLRKPLIEALEGLDVPSEASRRTVATVRMLLTAPDWLSWATHSADATAQGAYRLLRRAIGSPEVQAYLGVNRYDGVLWYHDESYDAFVWWLVCIVALQASMEGEALLREHLVQAYGWAVELQKAGKLAGYQVERLLAALRR